MAVQDNDSDSKTKMQLMLEYVQRNILKNVQFYFVAFLLLFLWQQMSISKQNTILQQMQKDNVEANSKVIGLTSDGRLVGIEKTKVDAASMQMVIARSIRDSFIVGRRELTKNYTVSNFQTPNDLMLSSDKLKTAFQNYVYLGPIESLSDEDKKFQSEAAQYYSAYMKYLLMQLNTNNLPHFISVTDMKIVQFVPMQNKFTIRLQLPCQTESIDNAGKVLSQMGVNEIFAEGMFDVSKGTTDNPFGLKIILKEMKIVEISPTASAGYTVAQ